MCILYIILWSVLSMNMICSEKELCNRRETNYSSYYLRIYKYKPKMKYRTRRRKGKKQTNTHIQTHNTQDVERICCQTFWTIHILVVPHTLIKKTKNKNKITNIYTLIYHIDSLTCPFKVIQISGITNRFLLITLSPPNHRVRSINGYSFFY